MKKPIQFLVNENEHHKLKVWCATKGIELSDLMRQGLQLACDKHGIKIKIQGGQP